jgi:Domain of unknown function (DUF6285)
MNPPPTSQELLEIVSDFLRNEAASQLSGATAFHALVAANVIDIVRRELDISPRADIEEQGRLEALLGVSGTLPELNEKLCLALRDGAVSAKTSGLWEHLWATTLATLSIDQPNYAAYRRQIAGDRDPAPSQT